MAKTRQSGGFVEGQSYKNEKHKVWTEYFLKKADANFSRQNILKQTPPGDTRYLYVIDMQNDFIDRNYNDNGKDTFGKFAVGDGVQVIKPIIDLVTAALKDERYKQIIFSRDFHPANHCSFGGPPPDGGNFPAHCVAGTPGTLIVKELTDLTIWENPKTTVVFKGMVQNVDSFSAVPYDSKQRSSGPGCKGCGADGAGCANAGTGAYTLNGTTTDALNYNTALGEASTKNSLTGFAPFTPTFPEGSIIEVCGLAGDYCVRDTAIALRTKYPGCTVVVLNDLVRYPFLPIAIPVAQHRNRNAASSTSVDNHIVNLGRFLESEENKGLNYYLFNKNGLMKKSGLLGRNLLPSLAALQAELPKFNPPAGKFATDALYFHFISDPRALIEDYTDANVKMVIPTVQGGFEKLAMFKGGRRTRVKKGKGGKGRSRKNRTK
jgi:nicotinamidase-related amidase